MSDGPRTWTPPKCPLLSVDIIIEMEDHRLLLIKRKNPPHGWALPGGFVDVGESLETAAAREALEETSLHVHSLRQLGAYSEPDRDPRGHTVSMVFHARAAGEPRAADDAKELALFHPDELPTPLAFDHEQILKDFLTGRGPRDPAAR